MRKVARWLQGALIADCALSLTYAVWLFLDHSYSIANPKTAILAFIGDIAGAAYALPFAALLEFTWRQHNNSTPSAHSETSSASTLRQVMRLAQAILIAYAAYSLLDDIGGIYLRLKFELSHGFDPALDYLKMGLQFATWILDVAEPLSLLVVLEALYPPGGFLKKYLANASTGHSSAHPSRTTD